jgi:hypothetical protein
MQWTLEMPEDALWTVLHTRAQFEAAIAARTTVLGGVAQFEQDALTSARDHLGQRCVVVGGWRGVLPYAHVRFEDGSVLVAFLHDCWFD